MVGRGIARHGEEHYSRMIKDLKISKISCVYLELKSNELSKRRFCRVRIYFVDAPDWKKFVDGALVLTEAGFMSLNNS
eukprot:snap_masked-scaffold_28-processed-gene-3.49-mRNA-1 protein AED:1.00 eAED:1.00 QI:0/-1/0/0/-1/1/1/0/77